jgi:hypothetical protein
MGSSLACKHPYISLFRSKVEHFKSHPIMKRLEDFEDSPLVPALLATIHAESDKIFMDVSPTCGRKDSWLMAFQSVQTCTDLSREDDPLSAGDDRETACERVDKVRQILYSYPRRFS